MILAPIVLFVYNRLSHTQKTVEALQKNTLAELSTLIIYSDGPKNSEDKKNIEEIRIYLKTIIGFKKIQIIEKENNEGLAKSIIDGVTETINKYGKIIVLEDDIVTSPGFIKYMNDALDLYENEPLVMHISGYMYPLAKNKLPETFFYQAASCWGWGTWKSAWNLLETNAEVLYKKLQEKKLMDTFNINTIHGFEQQLLDNISGKLHT
ncbi:MAG: glycosyltransferase family 2 protein, partial [Bacteroidales bacterium]|nr:glycosyltransferase family 2 protein [Bacteroidales bacterium]